MKFSGRHLIRRQQRTLARWVLALFCLVWIQAALLPCAMAVVPDGMAGAPEEHCPYCPPVHAQPDHAGAVGAAECAYPDQPQSDSRIAVPAALALTTLPVVLSVAPVPSDLATVPPEQARPPALARTPLAISYCRFLI